ncbi:endonuclease dU [Halomarina oriensis]|uniref:UPF0215 protein GQS65_09190 n=1 Tax=Halomarina oriensis TaxID=671145 RepID=A0A6B0GMF0_9EURY|nr:DUF99 family protein [Halomarina oriensis]
MTLGGHVLGVAESHGDGSQSTIAGAVVRSDRALDGLAFSTISHGGSDATVRIATLFEDLGREDVQSVVLAGVAPAWFNLVDLTTLAERVDRPVVAVSFEESEGLEPALREQFSGDALADRLAVYEALPERHPVAVNDETLFVRAVGCEESAAADLVRRHTPEGGRPEPLRVARLAARAADAFRTEAAARRS